MNLVADLQYFSPVIFFSYLNASIQCIFDQYEYFQKMSFMNRCTLLGGNGPINLTVPLDGGRNQKSVMKEVKILNTENWQDRHWKTITSCYNKSPWFDHYRGELENLYSLKFEFLIDWNLRCFQWICDKLAIKTPISMSVEFVRDYDKNIYDDLRGRLMPSTINKNFPDVVRYPQVFGDRFGFVPNLSVLDYLFCVGPRHTF
jgi:hypothetical protein